MKTNYLRGHWNGLRNANFRVLIATVAEVPAENFIEFQNSNEGRKMYPWSEAYKGRVIQMVEVVIDGKEPFYIANIDGSGAYKVTAGLGLPNAPHFSCRPSKIHGEVPKDFWIKRNIDLTREMQAEIASYWNHRDPVGYAAHREEIQGLLKRIQEMRSGRSAEQNQNDVTVN